MMDDDMAFDPGIEQRNDMEGVKELHRSALCCPPLLEKRIVSAMAQKYPRASIL